ncbi:MAG TPA: alpha/beta fold hydrolase [Tepidisphaeraceae bacterium]|nr:alpha/beta fold hydrolase [Tepidisphaeraceae bacterium]
MGTTAEPTAIVIFIPGQRARAEPWTQMVADAWGDRAAEVWGVNLPGYGGSSPGALDDVVPRALAVVDAARARHPGKRCYVQGASFGAAVAIAVAARRPVDGLIAQNPPPLRELLLGRYGWWNLWILAGPVASAVPLDLNALDGARSCTAPAIFIVSTHDGIVPADYQRQVIAAYAGPKTVIENAGAGHSDALTGEAAQSLRDAREKLSTSGAPR